jgi:hypothetical protein
MKHTKYLIFTIFVVTALLSTACGAKEDQPTQDPFILTAVAQTVAAKNNAEQNATPVVPPTPGDTPTPLSFSPTLTPLPPTPLPTVNNTGSSPCAKASLVSETIIDGTIFKPGAQFTKTWEIKNTSVCTWDSNYKIIFWDGNQLGGSYYYNLPQSVPPGAVVPISLVLTAPKEDGSYKSEWALQTPDKVTFGVGEYSAAFYTEIVVTSKAKPKYGVTSVEYKMVRTPETGCPANVTYTAYATIETNGPVEFDYYWNQSDGHTIKGKLVKLKEAGSIVITNSWQLHIATTPGTRWMAIVIGVANFQGDYEYVEYPHVEFTKLCGS